MSLRFAPWLGVDLDIDLSSIALRVGAVDVALPVRRLGPGDVRSVSERLRLQCDPAPGSGVFPSNCLAGVSFDDASFPWLLTSAPLDGQALRTPWLALVVLAEDEAADALGTLPGGAQTLTLAASRLPAFDELAAFAHVQFQGTVEAGTDLAELARAGDARVRSRLLAAKRLAPATRYVACLVPSFDVGRRAGLGEQPADPLAATPAWGSGDAPVTLPIYRSWRFATSGQADVETAARRLAKSSPPALPPAPRLTLSALGVPDTQAYRGLLRPVGEADAAPPAAAAAALQALLMQGAQAGERRVGLPWLGLGVGAGPGTAWAEALNHDPALRALAGLGARLVREQQDALVDAFWRQAGAVKRAQRLFVGAGLAATVGARLLEKHLGRAGDTRVLQALRPRIVTASAASGGAITGTVLFARFAAAASDAPVSAVPDSALRRVAGTRRLASAAAPMPVLVARDALRSPPLAADPLFAINTLAGPVAGEPGVSDVPVPLPPPVVIGTLVHAALAGAAADLAARARLSARVEFAGFAADAHDGAAAPRGSTLLDTPLVPALAALGAELVFSGVDALPDDSLLALTVDAAAVESLLVGANQELVRELQWRGAPVRTDATLLAQAWAGAAVPPLADWPRDAALGAHAPALRATVIVVRSALVARLAGLDPWLVQANAVTGGRRPGSTTMAPHFRGTLGEDIAYFGFALPPQVLAGRDGGTGWYFCFQQPPDRPRFGLDESATEVFARWSDLDWSRVNVEDGRMRLQPAPQPLDGQGLTWGRDGAQMAAILLQKPIRFAIHGSQLPGMPAEDTP